MELNGKLMEPAKKASSAEDAVKLAAENGYSVTLEEAEKYISLLSGNGPMSDDEMEGVTGGAGLLGKEAISWDDPRCERAARRARIFAGQFQECTLYNQGDKDEVRALCEEMCKCVYTPDGFDLVKAMRVFVDLSAKTHVYAMTVAATAGWNIFVEAFYNIMH